MRAMDFGRTAGVGFGLALAAMVPAVSQARETTIQGQATGASQTLIRLKAFEQARFKAFDDDWTVAPRRYGMH